MNATVEVWFVVILTVLTVVAVYMMLGNTIRELIKSLVNLRPCEVFYHRILILGLAFSGVIGILETDPHVALGESETEVQRSFMESVWMAVDDMTDVFWLMLLVMFMYLLVITILTAVLNRRRT